MATMSLGEKTLASNSVLNVSSHDLVGEPFPHIAKQDFIQADLYRRLKAEFPPDELFSRNTSLGGRAGRDLYRGDLLYEEFLKHSPAWRGFHTFINSSAYIDWTLRLFANHLQRVACKVDRRNAKFVDYVEPREVLADKSRVGRTIEKVSNLLAVDKHKDELFVRLDLAQAGVGYGKRVHCDRPNRLSSMIVYFCDAQEMAMEGGELLIHEHKEKKPCFAYERYPKAESTNIIRHLSPTENLGIFFLCCNNSYHSATGVKSQKGYRNFIYVSISSRAPSIW
jgi:hypothetical protein